MQFVQEFLFEVVHFIQRDSFQQSLCTAVEDGDLVFYRHRAVLGLYQQLRVLLSFVDCESRNGIHLTAEFGKRFQFAKLCLVDLQRSSHLLHRL